MSSERLVQRDSRSKYSTVSYLRKSVFLKQGCESGRFSHLLPRMEPKTHLWVCVRAAPVYVFCGPHCCLCPVWSLPGPVSTGAGALALGGDHSAMNRIGKRRIGTGWLQVGSQTGSTVAWSLQLLAGTGMTRNRCWGHPRASPPSLLIRKKSMTLEPCKARLHSRQQPACAREW